MATACRAQVSLRDVLIGTNSAAVKANIDRLQTIGSLMEKQSRVASWGVRTVTGPLPRRISLELPTTGYEDVKLVALARLLVTNIDSIQVDWPLYGPKLAQVALTMGADDVDGIAAVDPGTLGARRAPLEEILRNIRAAGLEPVERDARFARRAAQPLTA